MGIRLFDGEPSRHIESAVALKRQREREQDAATDYYREKANLIDRVSAMDWPGDNEQMTTIRDVLLYLLERA